MKRLSALGIIAAAALFCAAPLSLHWSAAKSPTLSFDTADARIGRPLTPGSVAGVNRRVHRRAYRRGAYYGAAAVGALPTVIIAAVRIGAQVFALVGTDPRSQGGWLQVAAGVTSVGRVRLCGACV
jgi:hypothetical protein